MASLPAGRAPVASSDINTRRLLPRDPATAGEEMFRAQKYSDITITCKDKIWRCHRAVLCGRCPFFEMACGDSSTFSEGASRVIILQEDDPAAIEELLLYLYTIQLPDTMNFKLAQNLFIVADKYDVKRLKDACAVYLKKRMAVEIATWGTDKCPYRAWMIRTRNLYAMTQDGTEELRKHLIDQYVKVAHKMGQEHVEQLLECTPEFRVEFVMALARARK